ncbi:MAG: hypothetical protein EBR82_71180 [Caulobacteraceae bacterium]|nr:hypothetical protein [Caulobacteraceae bacterium]
MYGARTYNIVAVQPYIDVVGIVAGNIVIIDRNGIGIKHSTAFGGTQTANVYTYEWYTTVTTTSVSTNRLRVNITGATVNLTTQLGTEKYKKGRYTTISGVNYIIIEQEAATAYPTLPAVAASYAFNSLTAITNTVETYLSEPLTAYTYTDSLTTTTQITGIPVVGSVNPGECVVDETAQRIWFDADLNAGEIIKVFQK